MTVDELRASIEATMEEAIFFQRIYPPQHFEQVNSYFGGGPRLPPDVDWPTKIGQDEAGKQIEEALTFIAQFDLSELPDCSSLTALPSFGTIFFFGRHKTGRVLYSPENTANFPVKAQPPSLPSLWSWHYNWLDHICSGTYQIPRSYRKWPVRGHLVKTYSTPPSGAERALADAWIELRDAMQAAEFQSAFGRPVEENRFPVELGESKQFKFPQSFPYNWLCVEVFAGFLISETIERASWEPLSTELAPLADKLVIEAKTWVDRARRNGRYVALEDVDRVDFWTWCGSVMRSSTDASNDPRQWFRLQTALERAHLAAPQFSLSESAEAAATIPTEYIIAQRWQYSAHLTGGYEGTPHVVQHRLLGNAPFFDYSQPEKHVLLAYFDSDFGMNWCWGDSMQLEFWITKSDLAARQFDNVVLKTSGYV
jgi:uncharacterized protein YwqG